MRSNSIRDFWSYVDKQGPIPEHVLGLSNCWIWMGCTVKEEFFGRKDAPILCRVCMYDAPSTAAKIG